MLPSLCEAPRLQLCRASTSSLNHFLPTLTGGQIAVMAADRDAETDAETASLLKPGNTSSVTVSLDTELPPINSEPVMSRGLLPLFAVSDVSGHVMHSC